MLWGTSSMTLSIQLIRRIVLQDETAELLDDKSPFLKQWENALGALCLLYSEALEFDSHRE